MLASSMCASADSTAVVQDCTQQPGRCSDRVDRVSVCASVRVVVCACVSACVCHVRACVSCLRVLYACAMYYVRMSGGDEWWWLRLRHRSVRARRPQA